MSTSESLSDYQMMANLQSSLDEEDGKENEDDIQDSQDVWEVDHPSSDVVNTASAAAATGHTSSSCSSVAVAVEQQNMHARAILYSFVLVCS